MRCMSHPGIGFAEFGLRESAIHPRSSAATEGRGLHAELRRARECERPEVSRLSSPQRCDNQLRSARARRHPENLYGRDDVVLVG
jgi:hypothetical protein